MRSLISCVLNTFPVGLCGEFRMTALVRGVNAVGNSSLTKSQKGACGRTVRRRPPANATDVASTRPPGDPYSWLPASGNSVSSSVGCCSGEPIARSMVFPPRLPFMSSIGESVRILLRREVFIVRGAVAEARPRLTRTVRRRVCVGGGSRILRDEPRPKIRLRLAARCFDLRRRPSTTPLR